MFPLTRRQEKRTEQGTCWRLCSCWTPLCVPRVTTWPCLLHGKQPGALDKCVAGTLDYVSLCHRGRVRVCTLVCYGLQAPLVQRTFIVVQHHTPVLCLTSRVFLATLLSRCVEALVKAQAAAPPMWPPMHFGTLTTGGTRLPSSLNPAYFSQFSLGISLSQEVQVWI